MLHVYRGVKQIEHDVTDAIGALCNNWTQLQSVYLWTRACA